MKILFVDESGDPGNPNIHPAATKFLIVGGVILSERNWLRLQDEIIKLRKHYKIKPARELKWSHLRSPRKRISLEHLDFEKRKVFAKNFLGLIKKIKGAKMSNLFETFLFAPSDQSIGVQAADFVVGAVSRWQNAKDEQYLKIIQNKFLRNKKGKIEGAGLKLFP